MDEYYLLLYVEVTLDPVIAPEYDPCVVILSLQITRFSTTNLIMEFKYRFDRIQQTC